MPCLNENGKFEPHPGQYIKFSPEYDKYRVIADVAGSGGGKTLSGAWWLYKQVREDPHSNYIVISADHTTLNNATLPTMQHVFEDIYKMGTWISSKNTFQIKIKGKNAGKIFMGSGENPYALEGAHVKAAWLDEAGRMPYLAWEVAKRRTRFHKGKILITTTPYATNWLKTEIFDRAELVIHHYADIDHRILRKDTIREELHTDMVVSQFDSIVNPHFPLEEYLEAQATMPSWRFKMFYKGEFERPPSMVYDNFDDGIHTIEDFEIPEHWQRYGMVDWGTTHPTAFIWAAIDPETDVTYLYREYAGSQKYARYHIKEIINQTGEEYLSAIYSDPARPDAINEMNEEWQEKHGNHRNWVFAADNNVDAGINLIYSKFATGKLVIFRSLKQLIDEIWSYQYDIAKDGMTVLEKPKKENDDLCDAMRYGQAGIKIGIVMNTFAYGSINRFPKTQDRLRSIRH